MNNHIYIICENKLGGWCNDQRQKFKNGNLSKEHIELLNKIPEWYWNLSDNFMENFICSDFRAFEILERLILLKFLELPDAAIK